MLEAQFCLPTNDERDEFALAYSTLHRLWEALTPDECLEPFRDDYCWLGEIYESLRPPSGHGRLLWHALGAKTTDLIRNHIHVVGVQDDLVTLILDPDMVAGLEATRDPAKLKKLEIQVAARIRRHGEDPLFLALGERLEKLRDRH